jgi:hypothetical protein
MMKIPLSARVLTGTQACRFFEDIKEGIRTVHSITLCISHSLDNTSTLQSLDCALRGCLLLLVSRQHPSL